VNDIKPAKNNSIYQFRMAIFIAVFVVFAILGFLLIQQLLFLFFPKGNNSASAPSKTLLINQGTLLFIHADQFNAKQPQLISVWAIFISKNTPPSLIAKSIYPDLGSPEKSQQIAQSFGYTEKTGLSPAFIKQIQSYDLAWNGYLLTDKEGLTQIARWVNGSHADLNMQADASNSQAVLEAEKEIFQASCKNLVLADSARGDKPRWMDLFPNHLATDLFFKDTAVNWDRITLSNPAPDCKVLVTP
jgi:hypothetical protein